jgi:hypothetical protein
MKNSGTKKADEDVWKKDTIRGVRCARIGCGAVGASAVSSEQWFAVRQQKDMRWGRCEQHAGEGTNWRRRRFRVSTFRAALRAKWPAPATARGVR